MRPHDTDAAVRSLRLVGDAQRDLASDSAWKQAVMEGIPVSDTRTRRTRSVLQSRPVLLAAAGVGALALTAGAATTVLRTDSQRIACWTGAEQAEDVTVTSADPVALCRDHWEEVRGEPAPPMVVYMDEQGHVAVHPEGMEVRSGLVQVDGDVALDPRPARLQAALDDLIDGLPSRCLDAGDAAVVVEADLERLGLVGWTVRQDGKGADGSSTCANAIVPEGSEERTVLLGAEEALGSRIQWEMSEDELHAYFLDSYTAAPPDGATQVGEGPPPEELARRATDNILLARTEIGVLRQALGAAPCLTVGEAEALVRTSVDASWNPMLDAEVDDTLDCAVVEVSIGGTWFVDIVGPSTVD